MASYELSKAADEDFEKLFEFGIDTFGFAQALNYQQGMSKQFEKVADQPERYAAVDHIRRGYRRCVYHSHSIYYRVVADRVLIVRVLGKQDVNTQFK